MAKGRGSKVVRAAGGVVWRRAAEGSRAVDVVLIHRPGYDDWSFPKGKADGDETAEETALREVEEETGLRCHLGPELVSTRYLDAKGRDKVVRYWAMTVEQQFHRLPDDEVDDWRWVPMARAPEMLSYDRDLSVLEALRNVLDKV